MKHQIEVNPSAGLSPSPASRRLRRLFPLRWNRRVSRVAAALLAAAGLQHAAAVAQTNSYLQTNLVSDGTVSAKATDPGLINPWGIAIGQQTPFWVNEAGSGASAVYDANGGKQFQVGLPPKAGSTTASRPTGIAFNASGTGFNLPGSTSATFVFVTLDGTIAGWNASTTNAITAVDNSASGAVYTGATLLTAASGDRLLVANFSGSKIEAYDNEFHPESLSGTFTDPQLPAGFSPYGIHAIGGNVYVAYAQAPSAGGPPVTGAGLGYVDVYDPSGKLISRVASGGTLNAPWAVVQAPVNFGAFGGDLLVGNFGDGTISAFDATTFAFKGQLQDGTGKNIVNSGLWDMVFGAQGTGDPNTLYFSAGVNGEKGGLFGSLAAVQPTPATGDFSLALSASTLSVAAGASGNLSVSLTPQQSFSGTVQFACSGLPNGTSCSFAPSAVSVSGAPMTTMVTITAAPVGTGVGQSPYVATLTGAGLPVTALAAFLPAGILLFALRRRLPRGMLVLTLGGFLSATALLTLSGCGYKKPSAPPTGTTLATANVTVTATSGSLSHSAAFALTVHQ